MFHDADVPRVTVRLELQTVFSVMVRMWIGVKPLRLT